MFEERVDQLTDLVSRVCRILFQSKGAVFDKLIEQKKTLKDPAKLDANVSRAIDLAFDNKELASISGELSQSINEEKEKHRLKINSRQVITLEEAEDSFLQQQNLVKAEDSLLQQQNQMDNRFRDVNEGFEQLMQNQAERHESMKELMSNQMPERQNDSQGS